MRGRIARAAVAATLVVAAGCTAARFDTTVLAGDGLAGRNNATQGSLDAQAFLIARLRDMGATGIGSTLPGDDAYRQQFTAGTNLVAMVPGTRTPDEYVVIGAHYDHLGSSCRNSGPADSICNGATDNATGVAAALDVARRILARTGEPRRSLVIALWDREEDGLLGSEYYTQHPRVPLADTVAYVNFDIQGANLLPSLRRSSFAVGAETGGARLTDAVVAAVGSRLDTHLVSSIFGQGRSDYVSFTAVSVPNVFFSDSTGPCYHTVDDEVGVVDFDKLDAQIRIATALTKDLLDGPRPAFVAGTPLATYQDAVSLRAVVDTAIVDIGRFTTEQQAQLLAFRDTVHQVVDDGPAAFDDTDVGNLLAGAITAVNLLTSGPCDGFLAPTPG